MSEKNQSNGNFFDSEEVVDDARRRCLKTLAEFLLPATIGAVLAASYVLIFSRGSSRSIFHHICNGFFLAAVLLMGCGGLSLVNKEGFFDVIQFGFKQLKETFQYAIRMDVQSRVDTDFDTFQKEKNKKRKGHWQWVVVGSVYLLGAVITLQFV
jgi:hypothetical protein